MLQRSGRPVPEPCAVRDLAFGGQPAKLGPQLLRRPDDQGLELVDGADLGHTGAVAGGQQHPQRLSVATTTRRKGMVLGEGLPGGADGVQGVALGPGAPSMVPASLLIVWLLPVSLAWSCRPGE